MPRGKKGSGSNIVGEMVEPSITVPTLQISDMPAVKAKRPYVRKAKAMLPAGTNDVLPVVPTTAVGGAVPGGVVKKRVKAIEAKSAPAPASMTTQEKRLKALEKARAVRKANKESGVVSVRKSGRPSDVSKEHYAETMKMLRDMAKAEKSEKKGARGRPSDVSKEHHAEAMEYLREAHKADKKSAKYMGRMDKMAMKHELGLAPERINGLIKGFRFHRRQDVNREVREIKHLAKEARKEVRKTGKGGEAMEELAVLFSSADVNFGGSRPSDMYAEF